ncbi:MAG: hypothetical protein OSJ38_00825, partial [Lachnospiraceae bacterium]|nr:hypothetical protein [Lachnospiraceae bacterium]
YTEKPCLEKQKTKNRMYRIQITLFSIRKKNPDSPLKLETYCDMLRTTKSDLLLSTLCIERTTNGTF